MAEPTPNPTPQGGIDPPEPTKTEPAKTDPPVPSVEEQIKAAVAAAKTEWDKGLDDKIKAAQDEAARLAKLSAAERQKEEDKAAKEKFEQEKAEFEHKKIVLYAETQLAKASLPTELAEQMAADSEENTKTAIDALKTVFDKAVEAEVTEKLKGKTPPMGGSHQEPTGSFMDAIRENQR